MAKRSKPRSGGAAPDIMVRRRRVRFGIAPKFAIPLSLVITALMVTFGWSIYNQARAALEERIEKDGVFAASAAAAPDWLNPDNKKRMRDLLSDVVEDLIVWENDDNGRHRFVESASGRKELEIIPDASYKKHVGNTLVRRGRMRSRAGDMIPYRSFRNAIANPDNPNRTIAQVEVIMSEGAIARQLAEIRSRIILFTILGILLGVAICFIVARMITRPLHGLIQDVEAVARGNLQHRTRVRSADEVGLLAEAVDSMTRGLEEGMQVKADLTTKEHDEHVAHEIQERLFPKTLPDIAGTEVDAVFEAGGEIASDLFDIVPVSEHETGLVVMSASGQGIPAAIVLAMARSVFRATVGDESSPAATLRRVNALFAPDLRRGMYVTCIYAIHDRRNHQVRIASAGHKLPALFFSHERQAVARIHPAGIAMGLDAGPVFDSSVEENDVTLTEGDALLLGTAGVLDLAMKSGEALGEKRFFKVVRTVLESGSAQPAQRVSHVVDSNVAEDAGDEDVTLVTLRRTE